MTSQVKAEVEMPAVNSEEMVVPITIAKDQDSVLNKLVKPHNKKSRAVTEQDLDIVVRDSVPLYQLCFTGNGLYKGAFAMHHSQINDTDPLNFFVTADKQIIINPEIEQHSSYLKDSKEACMTFADRPQTIVSRWQKVTVKYHTVQLKEEDKEKFEISGGIIESMSGPRAFIFQHEIDHGQALYIYQY